VRQFTPRFDPRAPTLRVLPGKQVFHRAVDFKLEIRDPKGVPKPIPPEVFYNGKNLTRSFLLQADQKYLDGGKRAIVTLSDLRLKAGRDHLIDFIYRREVTDRALLAKLTPPECPAFEPQSINHTEEFSTPQALVDWIERYSIHVGMNPSFIAGLFAQESGFNPKAVSWRKAIGLAQITPIAEEEIIRTHPEWPRFPKLNDLDVPVIKWLIWTEKVRAKNEWRLNPELTTQGALTYLGMIRQYWMTEENQRTLRNHSIGLEKEFGKLIAASYYAGPARIKRALEKFGRQWIRTQHLEDTRKYVDQVFSYCDAFSSSPLNPFMEIPGEVLENERAT